MSKLTKKEKIEIFNLWQNYQVNLSTINYLFVLINCHGTDILDLPYTSYSIAFKEQANRWVLVKDEAIYQVALDLGLKNKVILANWLRQ